MRHPFLAGYVVLVHLALAITWLNKYQPGLPEVVYVDRPYNASDAYVGTTRQVHKNMDKLVPAGSTLFLGDSITIGLDVDQLITSSVNYGISSQRSDQLLAALDTYASIPRASAVVLTIGTNDLWQAKSAGIEGRYDAILSQIPVRIFMSSVLPMTTVPDERVREVVEAGRRSCGRVSRCTFIDSYAPLAGHDEAFADGVHLTTEGYALWSKTLRSVLTRKSAHAVP